MAKMNREAIAVHVLTCSTYEEAAKQAGISISALYRLRQKPEFQEVVHRVKGQMFAEAFTKAQGFSLSAIETLKTIMEDTNATDSSRVAAARNAIKTYLPEKTSIEQTVYGTTCYNSSSYAYAYMALQVYSAVGHLNFKPNSTIINEYTGNFCFCLTG